MVIAIGRIVHYILRNGPNKGEHRPAIVVRTWSATTVNLQVFTDSNPQQDSNDQQQPVMWVTSAGEDQSGTQPGTWHWPEKTE